MCAIRTYETLQRTEAITCRATIINGKPDWKMNSTDQMDILVLTISAKGMGTLQLLELQKVNVLKSK